MSKHPITFSLFISICFFLVYAPLGLQGQHAVMAVTHEGDTESNREEIRLTIAFTTQVVETAFSEAGLQIIKQVSDASPGGIPLERIRQVCLEAEVRWGITVYTLFKEGRLTWSFSVYDAEEDNIRARDMFFVFLYAGISARNPIESSARQVAAQWQKSFDSHGVVVSEGQKFISSQEGVEVRFGDENGLLLGVIERGTLKAPPVPFTEGVPVYGTLMKKGFWSKFFSLPKGVTAQAMRLPLLQKKTRHTFGFLCEFRGNDQYAFDIEYRYNILPDRFFLALDYLFWLDFGRDPFDPNLFAHEVRFSPGLYLLPRRDLPVRLLAGTGVSLVFPHAIEFLLYPIWLGLEYHFPKVVALKTKITFAKTFDSSSYFLGFQDIWRIDNILGIGFSIGVMLKW